MLENVTAAISRIEDIKSHFRTARVGGPVRVAPHTESVGVSRGFADYLAKPPITRMKGSVESVSAYDGMIDSAARKYGIDGSLLRAVIQTESGFNPNAVSPAGARGLMQLTPSTAAALGVSDPFDPEQSIDGGARYLKQQIDRFGDVSLALAAYNAGPGAVMKYGGVPPFRETQSYVDRVLSGTRQFGGR